MVKIVASKPANEVSLCCISIILNQWIPVSSLWHAVHLRDESGSIPSITATKQVEASCCCIKHWTAKFNANNPSCYEKGAVGEGYVATRCRASRAAACIAKAFVSSKWKTTHVIVHLTFVTVFCLFKLK